MLYKNMVEGFLKMRQGRRASTTRARSMGTGMFDLITTAGMTFLPLVETSIRGREVFQGIPLIANPRVFTATWETGRFKDVSAQCGPGVTTSQSSRGCAFGDFDNDGDRDV